MGRRWAPHGPESYSGGMSTIVPAGGATQPPESHDQVYDLSVTGHLTPSGQTDQAYDVSVSGRMTHPPGNNDQAFELSIDQQVEKFLELRQKLSYFLITASIAVIAFSINFYTKNIRTDKVLIHHVHGTLLAAGAISALATAGLALINLQFGHVSARNHLKYRYLRLSYSELTDRQKHSWTAVNIMASYALLLAFVALFLEVLFLILFFWPIFV
jgi:hypothetical protein